MRRAEMHERHAERLEERAMHQAARGHFGRAMELERRAEIQSAEAMMGGGMRPYPMMGPCGYPGAGMRGAENAMIAGAMGGMVVAEEVAAANRLREAEMLMYGGGSRAYGGGYPQIYPPAGMGVGAEIFVQPGATVYPGTYPGYPPGAAYGGGAYGAGYPPGGAYPPAGFGYPQTGYNTGYRPYWALAITEFEGQEYSLGYGPVDSIWRQQNVEYTGLSLYILSFHIIKTSFKSTNFKIKVVLFKP